MCHVTLGLYKKKIFKAKTVGPNMYEKVNIDKKVILLSE